jgi:Mn2+/Fe2+ NRAMP family transporter
LTTSKLTPKVQRRATFRFKNFFKKLGPGLITGASDDDPSGIGTYSQAGAQLGFGIGWTMLLTYPLMVAIQEISGRIGRVTGHGIAGNVCRTIALPMSGALSFFSSSPIRSISRPILAPWLMR